MPQAKDKAGDDWRKLDAALRAVWNAKASGLSEAVWEVLRDKAVVSLEGKSPNDRTAYACRVLLRLIAQEIARLVHAREQPRHVAPHEPFDVEELREATVQHCRARLRERFGAWNAWADATWWNGLPHDSWRDWLRTKGAAFAATRYNAALWSPRAVLVACCEQILPFRLGPPGAAVSLSKREYTWLSIVHGNWPTPRARPFDTHTKVADVVETEEENIAQALRAYRHPPLLLPPERPGGPRIECRAVRGRRK